MLLKLWKVQEVVREIMSPTFQEAEHKEGQDTVNFPAPPPQCLEVGGPPVDGASGGREHNLLVQ